jgi:Uma2 family endonuclease
MSTTVTTMSWDEYQQLDEDLHAEYVDGRVVVNASPSQRHQRAVWRLANLLEAALTMTASVHIEWAWKPRDDQFVPDVLVTEPTDEQPRFTGTPLLAVEVLSSNRAHDLVTKTSKYAQAALPRYWIVDPDDETVTAFVLVEGVYRESGFARGTDEAVWDFGAGTVRFPPADLFG